MGREPGAGEVDGAVQLYGADYQILAGRPAELAARLRDLREAGSPVALVIGGVGGQDADGIEVLAAVAAPTRWCFGGRGPRRLGIDVLGFTPHWARSTTA